MLGFSPQQNPGKRAVCGVGTNPVDHLPEHSRNSGSRPRRLHGFSDHALPAVRKALGPGVLQRVLVVPSVDGLCGGGLGCHIVQRSGLKKKEKGKSVLQGGRAGFGAGGLFLVVAVNVHLKSDANPSSI